MRKRARHARVAVPGAHIQFANTVADLLNLSPSGALIRMAFELRKGGEWPLALDLPGHDPMWLHGRVVRCRRHDGAFVLALAFVAPPAAAQTVLEAICRASPPAHDKRPRPLPWRLPALSVERLLRLRVSKTRQCPECHSSDITKERRYTYSCYQCGCRFSGFRIGGLRVAL